MTAPLRRYSAVIYREQPETRWFRRYVLRRQWRKDVVHAGLLDALDVERKLGQPTKAAFKLHDPLEALSYVEA